MSDGSTVRRSASGARQGGDDFQHLVAWNRIMRARNIGKLQSIEIEAIDAGNLDDLVVHGSDGRSAYAQIRYAVDGATPLNESYFTTRNTPGGTSVLQKSFTSYQRLGSQSTQLMFISNRSSDPGDPVFTLIDGRTGLLIPKLTQATAGSAAGRSRAILADHLACDEPELLEFFAALEFRLGRVYQAELEHAESLMSQAGLRSDEIAIRRGIDCVRTWVLDGRRSLNEDEIEAEIDALDIRAADTSAVLHVQAIRYDLEASDADESLDWVDLFVGDSPPERRRVKDADAYRSVMEPELHRAAERILALGHGYVRVQGAMRLPAAFAVGASLPKVSNVELIRRQGPEIWTTNASSGGKAALSVLKTDVGQGPDVAIVIGLTNSPHEDVVRFVHGASLPVREVLTLYPAGGAADDVVLGAGNAIAWVRAVRDFVRAEQSKHSGSSVHLFLACPGAFAMFLGHRWNRVAPTFTYEDVGGSYEAAFEVIA